MERDILAKIRHPFIVKLHYGKVGEFRKFNRLLSLSNRRKVVSYIGLSSGWRSLHTIIERSTGIFRLSLNFSISDVIIGSPREVLFSRNGSRFRAFAFVGNCLSRLKA
jgi:hypothetical protein